MKKRLISVILIMTVMLAAALTAAIATSASEGETVTVPGDYNSDGAVDTQDILTLRKYLANYNYDTQTPMFELPEGADTNGDGVTDLKDVSALRYFVTNVSLQEQPDNFNKYTVSATGDVSYAWHIWEDGKPGAAVEGANTATLTGATDGETYVCVVSYKDLSIVSAPVIYMSEKTHPVCGEACECEDETHESLTWTPLLNLDDLKKAMELGGNYYLTADIIVDKSVSVKADTKLCLNGKKLTRVSEGDFSILSVTANTTLSVTDCSEEERVGYIDPESGLWCEGVYSGEGEAITYNLYGGVITGGSSAHGGAIYVRGTVELYGVNLAGNVATNNGGAIYLNGGSLIAKGDNVFVGNTAENHAGAIYVTYVKDVSDGVLTMNGGVFAHNIAMAGGAVSIRSNCEATFTNTDFVANSVAGDDGNDETVNGDAEGGGAIYVGYGALTLNNVTLTGNTAEMFGGAISAVKANVTVVGGEFKENTAVRGGAINLINDCTANFTGTKFTSNSATGEANYEGGGAINAEKGTLTLSGVIMDGNASAYYGGAINARKGEVIIKDDTVITNSEGSTGAALYFREAGTKVTITDVTVSNTNAKYNGVIYITQAGELTVNGLTASGNTANQGGVFYVSGGKITLNNVNASGNSAKINGGVIFVTSADMTVNGSSFSENTATNGGVIFVTSADVTVNGSSFSENTAIDGGVIFASKDAELTVNGSSFTENSASKGGALYVEGAIVEIGSDEEGNKTLFEGNTTTSNGGAIYVGEYSYTPEPTDEVPEPETEIVKSTVTVDGAELVNNTAAYGGAIYAEKGATVNVSNASFKENVANTNGGAIYVGGSSSLNVNNATFEGNSAGNYGGAINSSASVVTITGDNTLFKNNSAATHGGAIYSSYSGKVYSFIEVTGGRFEGNTAVAGGAVSSRTGCTATFVGTEFVSNKATGTKNNEGGGAIYTNNNTLILSGVTLDGNSGAYYGGAITVLGATVEIKDTVITNSKGGTGAAIYIREAGSKVTVTNSTVSNNTATANGVIYMTQTGTLTVNGLTASGNTAKQGGVFYFSGGVVTFNGVVASNNTATTSGNLMYITGASTSATVNCTAEEKAIWESNTYNSSATVNYVIAD